MEQIENKINNLPNLSSINFKIPELATINEPNIFYNETLDAVFDGVPIKIEIKGESYLKKRDQLCCVNILTKVTTKTLENMANINVYMEENKDKSYKAGIYVINKNFEMKNLGRTLWEMSLKLIQKSANKWNVPITDNVNRIPGMGLSQDKWDKLFFPLLEKHGYIRIDDGLWEKIYFPNKK